MKLTLHFTAASIEAEIDNAHRAHPLLKRPYADAIAHLLLSAEETVAADAVTLEMQDRSISLTAVSNALKHAVGWISRAAERRRPLGFSQDAMREARDFLQQAGAYLAIVAAYSFAHRNFIDLRADGRLLVPTLPKDEDARYDAYDLLVLPTVDPGRRTEAPPSIGKLTTHIQSCLDRGFSLHAIPLTRSVLAAAAEVSAEFNDLRHQLPDDWQLSAFSLGEFRVVSNTIRAALGAWQIAHQLHAAAARHNPTQLLLLNVACSWRR